MHMIYIRLASLVSITKRETGVGKLGWQGNSTGKEKIGKKTFFLFCVTKEKRKISLLIYILT